MIDLYDSKRRLEAAERRLLKLPYRDFLDHLKALRLSDKRVLKYANLLGIKVEDVPMTCEA